MWFYLFLFKKPNKSALKKNPNQEKSLPHHRYTRRKNFCKVEMWVVVCSPGFWLVFFGFLGIFSWGGLLIFVCMLVCFVLEVLVLVVFFPFCLFLALHYFSLNKISVLIVNSRLPVILLYSSLAAFSRHIKGHHICDTGEIRLEQPF